MGKEQELRVKQQEKDGRIAIWRSLRNYQSAKILAEENKDSPMAQEFYQTFAQYYLENVKSIIDAIFPGKTLGEIFPKPNEPT